MAGICEIELRVRYQETDQMAIVYHANYLNWFEVGRTEWLRQSGMNYRQLEEAGLILPVTEVNCKYHASAKYDDLVKVKTWLADYNGVRLTFGYVIHRAVDGELLTTGTTHHVFVDRDRRIVRLSKMHPELDQLLKSTILNQQDKEKDTN